MVKLNDNNKYQRINFKIILSYEKDWMDYFRCSGSVGVVAF